MLGSTCFGHHYAHHQELTTIAFGYRIGRLVLELLLVGSKVQAGWMGVRTEGCYSQHSTSNQQQLANQTANVVTKRYRRELLMMGTMVPETR